MATDQRTIPGTFAQRFFFASLLVYGSAGTIAWTLARLFPPGAGGEEFTDPLTFFPAFWASSALLLLGSFALYRSRSQVRIERQRPFRRWLIAALVLGTGFVGVQSYALWRLLQVQTSEQAATGAGAFVFVVACLHGLHFTIALLFLTFVTLRALAGRYDHEYFWGVTVCAYFWHVLLAVWMAVLAVFAVAS